MRNKKRRCKLKNCWSHGYNYWNAGKTSARHELLSNGLSRFTGQRDNNQIFILLLSLKDRPIPLPMLCFSSQSLSNDKNSWQELYRNEMTPNSHWLCRKKGLHTKLLRNNSHKEDTTPSKKKNTHIFIPGKSFDPAPNELQSSAAKIQLSFSLCLTIPGRPQAKYWTPWNSFPPTDAQSALSGTQHTGWAAPLWQHKDWAAHQEQNVSTSTSRGGRTLISLILNTKVTFTTAINCTAWRRILNFLLSAPSALLMLTPIG